MFRDEIYGKFYCFLESKLRVELSRGESQILFASVLAQSLALSRRKNALRIHVTSRTLPKP